MIKLNEITKLKSGDIIYCKLTGKKFIIRKFNYKVDSNPMFDDDEREIDTIEVRYLSHKHDEFKIINILPSEISLTQIIKDYYNGKTKEK